MSAHTFSFYLPTLEAGHRTLDLDGEEHEHLKRVLRLRPGERIRVTNGRGLVVTATVETVAGASTRARVDDVAGDETPAARLALALPLLKRPRFDAAVAQCVEVGMTELIPLYADKCHVREWSDSMSARTTRVALAAMKQSGRGWLPPVRAALDIDALAQTFSAYAAVVLADAGGEAVPAARGDVLAIVGPEGGFSDRETDRLFAAGARRVTLSRHRLRAETAAVVLVSLLARAR